MWWKMENYSNVELSDLLLFVSKIRKEKPEIAINDYHNASSQLEVFCKSLNIEDTDFYKDRKKKIFDAGRSSVYKSCSADIRLLSSDDITVPDLPIIDLTINDNITVNRSHPATIDKKNNPPSSLSGGNDD